MIAPTIVATAVHNTIIAPYDTFSVGRRSQMAGTLSTTPTAPLRPSVFNQSPTLTSENPKQRPAKEGQKTFDVEQRQVHIEA